ncbi:MAG: S-adenosylmethionine:tRNA ribosyltransferase-isomerase, partial [Candidatus Marinimicrobia bacterium]|nr:S-adenosylmethionine:tRNA ribosyltransferase-isomerase [Candidatus Neomarinimicrobiota bacterium]
MIDKKKKYKLGDFNYRLPKDFIAQNPEARRDYSKLMVVHRDTGEIEHKKFYNILDYMRKNDLLVLNNTKVFPARLFATKDRTDAKVEVFLLRELSTDLWEVMVRPARKVRIGNKLVFNSKLMCDVIDNTVSGGRVVRFEHDAESLHDIIDKIGISPLPPYINRDADNKDKKRYQTVYATERGAVAAPTAGLHFTDSLLGKAKEKGIKIETVTLHIGLGTFR